jgi:malate dehydrogenase (oxaloacetate-decarboxylating)
MKLFSMKVDPLTGEDYYEVYLRGPQLLNNALLNKGSCFSQEERLGLELEGFLRAEISTIEAQVERSLAMYRRKTDDLERYIFLQGLLDRDETLFYRLLSENLEEMVPIVYTPTVGQACLQLSHITRRFRGVYLSPDNIATIDRILQSVSLPQVNLIVVTDGERILGLGDLGSDGMGIPVGKVNLYVAAGGIHPACCLPIMLDVGTNNERLLADPLYMGIRRPRLAGKDYDDFIERFVLGVKRNFPSALLQWEDFAKHKAFPLMERYRERIPSFNDDIQGTGAVVLSALITAMRIKGKAFADQRFVIVGMGQAGAGVAFNIKAQLGSEGLGDEEIRRRIFAIDKAGLLVEGMAGLEPQMRPFTHPRAAVEGWGLDHPDKIGLRDAVRNGRPTVLVGLTAQAGLFDRAILEQMAGYDPRPVVLPLSNPNSKSECTPQEVFDATRGRGLIATGSPFPPVLTAGRSLLTSQCNNMYVFPGVGLGALVSRSSRVTSGMFLAASRTLSDMVSAEQRECGLLLPEMKEIRAAAFRAAMAVAKEARNAGLGRLLSDEELAVVIRKAQWEPRYYPYRPGPIGG